MEDKTKEAKRAKTVRSNYCINSENLLEWLRGAELKVQDKTSDPYIIKDAIQKMQVELPAMKDKLEILTADASLLCENTDSDDERTAIERNVNSISEQMALVRSWIDMKKQQVGDCLDSWERFLSLFNTVMAWVKEKHEFLSVPLQLDSLNDAKQKQHDYGLSVKSSKGMTKVISDMSKELDHIGENGSTGDLSSKMEEAENAKAEVEAKLLERHALLNEASEEWDQCEKKLKEVRQWLDKCKNNLDSGNAKKKSLRDQLASREKMIADITIQKTKIEVSIEKLWVHFKSELRGAKCVVEAGNSLKAELDGLLGVVKQQSMELEATIAQVEQYQQDILQLKQEVVSSEQKLRMVSNPSLLPTDRDSAQHEQNELLAAAVEEEKRKLKLLVKKIEALEPTWQASDELKVVMKSGQNLIQPISYRVFRSPARSPKKEGNLVRELQESSGSSTLFVPTAKHTRSRSPMYIPGWTASFSDIVKGCSRSGSRVASPEAQIKSSADQTPHVNVIEQKTEKVLTEMLESSQPNISISIESSLGDNQSIPGMLSDKSLESDESFVHITASAEQRRGRSPTRRKSRSQYIVSESTNIKHAPELEVSKDISNLSVSSQSSSRLTSSLSVPLKSRSRSKSPMYIPGESVGYADILKGTSRVKSVSPSKPSVTTTILKGSFPQNLNNMVKPGVSSSTELGSGSVKSIKTEVKQPGQELIVSECDTSKTKIVNPTSPGSSNAGKHRKSKELPSSQYFQQPKVIPAEVPLKCNVLESKFISSKEIHVPIERQIIPVNKVEANISLKEEADKYPVSLSTESVITVTSVSSSKESQNENDSPPKEMSPGVGDLSLSECKKSKSKRKKKKPGDLIPNTSSEMNQLIACNIEAMSESVQEEEPTPSLSANVETVDKSIASDELNFGSSDPNTILSVSSSHKKKSKSKKGLNKKEVFTDQTERDLESKQGLPEITIMEKIHDDESSNLPEETTEPTFFPQSTFCAPIGNSEDQILTSKSKKKKTRKKTKVRPADVSNTDKSVFNVENITACDQDMIIYSTEESFSDWSHSRESLDMLEDDIPVSLTEFSITDFSVENSESVGYPIHREKRKDFIEFESVDESELNSSLLSKVTEPITFNSQVNTALQICESQSNIVVDKSESIESMEFPLPSSLTQEIENMEISSLSAITIPVTDNSLSLDAISTEVVDFTQDIIHESNVLCESICESSQNDCKATLAPVNISWPDTDGREDFHNIITVEQQILLSPDESVGHAILEDRDLSANNESVLSQATIDHNLDIASSSVSDLIGETTFFEPLPSSHGKIDLTKPNHFSEEMFANYKTEFSIFHPPESDEYKSTFLELEKDDLFSKSTDLVGEQKTFDSSGDGCFKVARTELFSGFEDDFQPIFDDLSKQKEDSLGTSVHFGSPLQRSLVSLPQKFEVITEESCEIDDSLLQAALKTSLDALLEEESSAENVPYSSFTDLAIATISHDAEKRKPEIDENKYSVCTGEVDKINNVPSDDNCEPHETMPSMVVEDPSTLPDQYQAQVFEPFQIHTMDIYSETPISLPSPETEVLAGPMKQNNFVDFQINEDYTVISQQTQPVHNETQFILYENVCNPASSSIFHERDELVSQNVRSDTFDEAIGDILRVDNEHLLEENTFSRTYVDVQTSNNEKNMPEEMTAIQHNTKEDSKLESDKSKNQYGDASSKNISLQEKSIPTEEHEHVKALVEKKENAADRQLVISQMSSVNTIVDLGNSSDQSKDLNFKIASLGNETFKMEVSETVGMISCVEEDNNVSKVKCATSFYHESNKNVETLKNDNVISKESQPQNPLECQNTVFDETHKSGLIYRGKEDVSIDKSQGSDQPVLSEVDYLSAVTKNQNLVEIDSLSVSESMKFPQDISNLITPYMKSLVQCLKEDKFWHRKIYFTNAENDYYMEKAQQISLQAMDSVQETSQKEIEIMVPVEDSFEDKKTSVSSSHEEDTPLIEEPAIVIDKSKQLVSVDPTQVSGNLELTETIEPSESSKILQESMSSLDTISSKDISKDQSVDDICVDITGTIENLHPESRMEITAHINIDSSDVCLPDKFSSQKTHVYKTDKVVHSKKTVRRVSNIVENVSGTVEGVVEPDIVHEIIKQSHSTFPITPLEGSGAIFKGERVVKKLIIDGQTIIEDPKALITEVSSEEVPSHIPIDQTSSPIIQEPDDDLSVQPCNDPEGIDEIVLKSAVQSYQTQELPEMLSAFPQEISNLSSSEFVSTVQSSVRTTVKRVRRVVKKVVIRGDKEEVTEEVFDEPEEVEVEKSVPSVVVQNKQFTQKSVHGLDPSNENFSSTVTGSASTSTVHTVTRAVNSVVRRIRIIDGKEVVTEEVIHEPGVDQLSNVLVSHKLSVLDETVPGFSNAPDILVNVPSVSSLIPKEESSSEDLSLPQHENINPSVDQVSRKITAVDNGISQVEREITPENQDIKGIDDLDVSGPDSSERSDLLCEQRVNEIAENIPISSKDADDETSESKTHLIVKQFVITTMTGGQDFIVMEKEHTEANLEPKMSSESSTSLRFLSKEPTVNVITSMEPGIQDDVSTLPDEEKLFTKGKQKSAPGRNTRKGSKPSKTTRISPPNEIEKIIESSQEIPSISSVELQKSSGESKAVPTMKQVYSITSQESLTDSPDVADYPCKNEPISVEKIKKKKKKGPSRSERDSPKDNLSPEKEVKDEPVVTTQKLQKNKKSPLRERSLEPESSFPPAEIKPFETSKGVIVHRKEFSTPFEIIDSMEVTVDHTSEDGSQPSVEFLMRFTEDGTPKIDSYKIKSDKDICTGQVIQMVYPDQQPDDMNSFIAKINRSMNIDSGSVQKTKSKKKKKQKPLSPEGQLPSVEENRTFASQEMQPTNETDIKEKVKPGQDDMKSPLDDISKRPTRRAKRSLSQKSADEKIKFESVIPDKNETKNIFPESVKESSTGHEIISSACSKIENIVAPSSASEVITESTKSVAFLPSEQPVEIEVAPSSHGELSSAIAGSSGTQKIELPQVTLPENDRAHLEVQVVQSPAQLSADFLEGETYSIELAGHPRDKEQIKSTSQNKPEDNLFYPAKPPRDSKKTTHKEKSKGKINDSHIKIRAKLSSENLECSSNVEYMMPSDEHGNVSLAIHHTDDTVNFSVSSGGEVISDQPLESKTSVNVNIDYGKLVDDDPEIQKNNLVGSSPELIVTEKGSSLKTEFAPKSSTSKPLDPNSPEFIPAFQMTQPMEYQEKLPEIFSEDKKPIADDSPMLIEHVTYKIKSLKSPPLMYQIMEQDFDNKDPINIINNNINKIMESNVENEDEAIVKDTIMTITECIETITYKIYIIKTTTLMTQEDKLVRIKELEKDLHILGDAVKKCKGIRGDVAVALANVTSETANSLELTSNDLRQSIAASEEFKNGINNVSVLLNDLANDIENLSKDQSTPIQKRLDKLDELDEDNEGCLRQVARLRLINGEVESVANIGITNRANIFGMRDRYEQKLSLTQEYLDSLAELEKVIVIAETIVSTKPHVNSLEHLQHELQKDRKFFANLTRCRALIESLETHLDDEVKASNDKFHSQFHQRASRILELASERAEAMSLVGSKWTVLESTLREERAWLGVAAQRVPGLAGVTSRDYDQYISLYQALSNDVTLHNGRIWHALCIAHSLQEWVTCQSLEECCEELRAIIKQLESRVSLDFNKLMSFKQVWNKYESLTDQIDHWLSRLDLDDKISQSSTNIVNFWELKASYEVYKEMKREAGIEFETAVQIVPISDESVLRMSRNQGSERWARLEALLLSLEESLSQSGSTQEKLHAYEERLKAMSNLLDKLEKVNFDSDKQVALHSEQLQVLKHSVIKVQEELGLLGALPAELADSVGQAISNARVVEDRVTRDLQTVNNLESILSKIIKGLDRLSKDHTRSSNVLEQAALAKKSIQSDLLQALNKCQDVNDRLADDQKILYNVESWVQDVCEISPSIGQVLIMEMKKAASTQKNLSALSASTLSDLSERAKLWENYTNKRDSLRSSVRQANYMMDLLSIKGRIDYEGLVKASAGLTGVSERLDKAEGEEVWKSASELAATLDAEEAAGVEAEAASLQADLEATVRHLRQMSSRYRRAADLWVAAARIQHHLASKLDSALATISSQPLPSELPKVTEEEKLKLQELENLADEIAQQIGVDRQLVLGTEVDLLGHRLKDVESSLEDLEAIQSLAPTEYHQDLSEPLPSIIKESCEDTVENLITLRDHLISLGTRQPQSNDTRQNKDKLQLWEELFSSTFKEYRRVSSHLASTREANTLVKLWRDYLDHVNKFLSAPIPDEYHSLNEHTSLCQAHQNVIGSQHNILESKKSSVGKIDKTLVEEFNALTNLHNETLAKIMDRQHQVQDRIAVWERYRDQKKVLLSWLSDMETARGKLNLRYLKMKMVPKVVLNVQDLLDRMDDGDKHEKILRDLLGELLMFCEDETLAKSLRLDQGTISQRIANMAAGFNTWKGYLIRINEYIRSFESQYAKISKGVHEVRAEVLVESSIPMDASQAEINSQLQHLQCLQEKLAALSNEMESLNETEDRLKEYVSPNDAKTICQKVWLIKQQLDETERQIEIMISSLQERLRIAPMYYKREAKFLDWVKSVVNRLEEGAEGSSGEPSEQLAVLEAEIQAEVGLKKKEVEWLLTTREVLKRLDPPLENLGSGKESVVSSAWATVQNATQLRANKLRALIQSTSKLEIRLEELRLWIELMEAKLNVPIKIKSSKKDEITRLTKEQEELHREIESKSSDVADILNSCEIILSDCATCHVTLDTQGISLAMDSTEKRWKGICVKSAERKINLKNLWGLIQQLIGLHKKQQSWLNTQNKKVNSIADAVSKAKLSDLSNLANNAQKLEAELRGGCQGLSLVEELYSKVASSACVDSVVIKDLSNLLLMWYNVRDMLAKTCRAISSKIDKINRFNELQSELVVGLSAVDALLTMAEAGRASSPSTERTKTAVSTEVAKAKLEMARLEPLLSKANFTCEVLLSKVTNQEDKDRVEQQKEEYQSLWKNVSHRLLRLDKQLVNQSVEANTLKFEADKSTQVDTLERSAVSFVQSEAPSPVTRKEAYLCELDLTMKELIKLIESMETKRPSSQPNMSKQLGGCQSTMELVRHLSDTLVSECGATEQEARMVEIAALEERLKKLQTIARESDSQLTDFRSLHLRNYRLTCEHVRGKLTCPLCSAKNWKQWDNDIWRLERWLQDAEGTLALRTVAPRRMEELEDAIQDHRELMLDLDSHQRLVVALNIVGNHLAEHADDRSHADELTKRLDSANSRWERIASATAVWHAKLQQALIQNEEFHENMANLVEWLESTEIVIKQSEPVDLTDPTHIIRSKYNKFQELHAELERCEPRVRSLEEAAEEVLRGSGRQDTVERLAQIRVRLESLSRLVGVYVLKLGAVLGDTPSMMASPSLDTLSHQLLENAAAPLSKESEEDVVDTGPLVRSCKFFGRVVRASLPISALLLLVLGATTLIPITEDDFSCTFTNNLLTSFTPVLRYPYGRPPI